MSGIALIVNGADFSARNLGKVTFLENKPITGLKIELPSSIEGDVYRITPMFTPIDTTERNLLWEITDGQSYASIDQNGNLTIKSSATGNSITVKVTSVNNTSLSSTVTTNVTYKKEIPLESMSIIGATEFTGSSTKYSVAFTPSGTTQTRVEWSIDDGDSYATIDNNGNLDIKENANNSRVIIRATSIDNPSISATHIVYVTYAEMTLGKDPESKLSRNHLTENYVRLFNNISEGEHTATKLNIYLKSGESFDFSKGINAKIYIINHIYDEDGNITGGEISAIHDIVINDLVTDISIPFTNEQSLAFYSTEMSKFLYWGGGAPYPCVKFDSITIGQRKDLSSTGGYNIYTNYYFTYK